MSQVSNVTADKFENEVLSSQLPVLVDFWAPWCGPCQMMAPVLEEIGEELAGKVSIAKVDVDEFENQKLAMQYQIRSIPNMKVFKGGQVVKELIGFMPKEELLSELQEFISAK